MRTVGRRSTGRSQASGAVHGASVAGALIPALLLGAALVAVTPPAVRAGEVAPGAVGRVDTTGWIGAAPGHAWSFPEDHWSHPGYRSEWWYLTGHLESASGRRFGYQFTFFRVGLACVAPTIDSHWAASDLIMGHAALTDVDRRQHRFSEVLYRAVPMLGGFGVFPDSLIAWSLAPPGTDARWELRWNGAAFDVSMADAARDDAFTLATRPVKPFVFQGPGGVSRKAATEDAASLYYSNTRLATSGTLTIDGERLAVTGTSWMDKEFGSNQLASTQVGWDWLSLQLDDGRELMLYLLRDAEGRVDYASGTLVDADGAASYLQRGDFAVTATGSWRSPASGINYPLGWRVDVPAAALDLRVVPEIEAQENCSRQVDGLCYWEGAVRISGGDDDARIGRGFVELTGYGDARRPAL